MSLVRSHSGPLVKLRLARPLNRVLKRGHPWVFADALRERPPARPGAAAVLLNKKGRELAHGIYDPHSPLAFRVCSVEAGELPDNAWAGRRFRRALALRQTLFGPTTTGFRLFNGEGDGLPGLICDVYGDTAVIQLDGPGPEGFWNAAGVADWLAQALPLRAVCVRPQARQAKAAARSLVGPLPVEPVPFVENGLHFTADVVRGQKTGFFLDQRENRQRAGRFAEGCRVLNLFGYTGGFSVYAGAGGAAHVTTVDLSGPALEQAGLHWQLNGLPPERHRLQKADAFRFLEQARRRKERWEVVIADPPSFAPSQEAVQKARAAYQSLIAASAAVTAAGGILAAASCSSHISPEMFLNLCQEGVSQARRQATLLGIFGQPADHPTPLVFSEFRYLKFVLLRVE